MQKSASMSWRQHVYYVIHHTLPPPQFVLLGLLVPPRPRHPDYQGDPGNPEKRRFFKPSILGNTKIYSNFPSLGNIEVAQVVQLLTRRSQGMVLMCAHAGDVRLGHLFFSSRWRHNGRDSVSNHQPHDCLFNGLLRRRSKKTSKLRFTGLCAGNSPGTGEFPAQMASYAENVSIWWRHHVSFLFHDHILSTNILLYDIETYYVKAWSILLYLQLIYNLHRGF